MAEQHQSDMMSMAQQYQSEMKSMAQQHQSDMTSMAQQHQSEINTLRSVLGQHGVADGKKVAKIEKRDEPPMDGRGRGGDDDSSSVSDVELGAR